MLQARGTASRSSSLAYGPERPRGRCDVFFWEVMLSLLATTGKAHDHNKPVTQRTLEEIFHSIAADCTATLRGRLLKLCSPPHKTHDAGFDMDDPFP